MEEITLQELKALVAQNSRAISRQWHEELAASRQQWLYLATISDDVFDISQPAGFKPGSSQTDPSGWHG